MRYFIGDIMSICNICPRKCGIDREKQKGFCGVDALKIAKACLHYGEEPPISGGNGSGTVFFSGCSLKCVFCQNMPISRDGFGKEITIERLAEIFLILKEKGADNINLVTPTHYAGEIIKALEKVKSTLEIPVIYNCGGYENVETLKRFEGLIDVYLPDFKYADRSIAKEYSGAENYPDVVIPAIKEMFRQVGAVRFNEKGLIEKGVIIRHMVLPSHRHDSMKILELIKENLPIDKIKISLLRQYTPCGKALEMKNLSRKVTTFEYNSVADYAENLGFDGYLQERSSATFEMTPDWDLEGV